MIRNPRQAELGGLAVPELIVPMYIKWHSYGTEWRNHVVSDWWMRLQSILTRPREKRYRDFRATGSSTARKCQFMSDTEAMVGRFADVRNCGVIAAEDYALYIVEPDRVLSPMRELVFVMELGWHRRTWRD